MPLGLYLLVVLTALFAQRVNAMFSVAFLGACLVLPLLTDKRAALASTLVLQRAGWRIVVLLAIGSFVGSYAVNWLAAKMYWGTILLRPPLGKQMELCARQFAIYLPLAFAEEFFFRGYLQETVFRARWNDRGWRWLTWKNLAAALLFGLAHVVSHVSLGQLPRVLSGIVLGWIVERSERSVWPATFLHAASNVAVAWAASLMVR